VASWDPVLGGVDEAPEIPTHTIDLPSIAHASGT
jgi:hypothetical protein